MNMTKQKTINPTFPTVLIDFDGTLFDTTSADPFSVKGKGLRRFSPEWVKAHNEYLEHIRKCPLYDGWLQVFEFLQSNNIQAAIVSGNNRQVLNVAVKAAGLKDVFPKDKINRIGCNDVNGRRVKKSEGDSALFEYALNQLEIAPENALAFGNQFCDAQVASKAGIKAYHCLWGANDEDRELMLADTGHQCLTSPLQIIDILRSEHTSQSQTTKNDKQ